MGNQPQAQSGAAYCSIIALLARHTSAFAPKATLARAKPTPSDQKTHKCLGQDGIGFSLVRGHCTAMDKQNHLRHHLRNPGMSRLSCKYQQTMVSTMVSKWFRISSIHVPREHLCPNPRAHLKIRNAPTPPQSDAIIFKYTTNLGASDRTSALTQLMFHCFTKK